MLKSCSLRMLPRFERKPETSREPISAEMEHLPAGHSEELVASSLNNSEVFVSLADVVQRTPWTAAAVRSLIRRGVLQEGVHFFQPAGPRGRLLFDWQAIERLIRRKPSDRHAQEMDDNDVESIRKAARALFP